MGLEAILFGAAANAATGAAATAGLLGTGGAFSLGSALSAVGTGLSVVSGFQQMQAGKEAAQQQYETTANQVRENARLTEREAQQELKAADQARRQQKIAYLSSGVSLSGSPLLVMEETRRRGIENAAEVQASGRAANKAAATEGRMQARNYYTSGRNAFLGSVAQGFSNYARVNA